MVHLTQFCAARDGEQEMLEEILLSEPPESKMLLALLSGSVIGGGALFVCWLSGSNPTGLDTITHFQLPVVQHSDSSVCSLFS